MKVARKKSPTVKIKKPKVIKQAPAIQGAAVNEEKDEKMTVAMEPQVSPKEQEKEEVPALIRLSTSLGKYAGSTLGGLAGARFGFASMGASYGAKYGSMLAEYGAKRLVKSMPILGQFKKGGKVHKTGAYILHKGERVIPSRK